MIGQREILVPDTALFAMRASHLGKSARSRAKLIDAALAVFARDGLEAASVHDIARHAGMANGTFYLHFKDKDELTSVVILLVAAEIAREMNEAMAGIDDAVERVSLGTRQFINIACTRMEWGSAYFQAFWVRPELRAEVALYMRRDLERGVAQGAFSIKVDDFLVDLVGALVIAALFARMKGTAGPEAGSKAAEMQLRLLGVDAAHAHEVAWRSLESRSVVEPPDPPSSTPK
jgi:AcrR family transcriptional regulator